MIGNKMKLRKILNILLLILLSGCVKSPTSNTYLEIASTNSGQIVHDITKVPLQVTNTIEFDVTIQDSDVSLTPSALSTTQISCDDLIYYTKEIEALQIWWQPDGQALLFVNRSEEAGIFDFFHNKIIFDQSLSNPNGRIPDQIRKNIPNEIKDYKIYLSPTTKKAIYWVPYYTSPTPTPQIIGVPSGEPEIILDLYWLEEKNTESSYLGRVENLIHQIYWSPNETFVLLGTGPSFYTTSILLFDLEKDFMKHLTIETDTNNAKGLYPIDFTPDSQSILFRINGDIYLKNIQTGVETKLEMPLFRYHWWISEQSFIAIIDDDSLNPFNSGLYVYDIENDVLSKISNIPVQSDAYFIPNSILLSPDNTKIGFIDRDYHLNVIDLCPEFLLSNDK